MRFTRVVALAAVPLLALTVSVASAQMFVAGNGPAGRHRAGRLSPIPPTAFRLSDEERRR